MGFPNIDKILIKMFLAGFNGLKADPSPLLDIFDDFDEADLAQVAHYITRKRYNADLRDHEEGQVYIVGSFPRADMMFPQITVNLGEDNSDRYMGDSTGESIPVLDGDDNLIAHDIVKGYYGKSHWLINIIAATKDETIWLSRCCQYFICLGMLELAQKGMNEIDIAMADLRPDQQQLPMEVFNRAIKITGVTENTWKVRVPVYDYTTGTNLAL